MPPALRAAARDAWTTLRPHRWWIALWLPLGCWYASPLWSAHVLPLHDLPNHLARITAYHYLDDPRWNLAPYYRRSLQLVPYLGHYYLVHLLTYVVRSVVVANLVFMTAYVVTAPLCGLALARATGRSPWLALLLLPLSVSLFFHWGFIAFCVGGMLLLPALAALFRLIDEPSRRRAVALALWAAALYLFHIVPWAVLVGTAAALAALELTARRTRGPRLAAAAIVPSLALLAVGLGQARSIGYVGQARYEAVTDTPGKLMARALSMINLFQGDNLDEWIAIGLMLALLLLIVSDAGPGDEPWRRRIRLPLVFVLSLALAAVTPFWVRRPFNWWMINQRFFLPAAAVAIFLPRGPIRGGRAALLGAGVLLTALLPLPMIHNYCDFSRRAEPIIELIRLTPLGANTLLLHPPRPRDFSDPVLAPTMTVWRELYNYPLVYRGGYDPYLYDDGFPIRRVAMLAAPKVERAAETIYSPDETRFDAGTMLRGWSYYVVPAGHAEMMPADGVVAVRRIGDWILFRNLSPERTP